MLKRTWYLYMIGLVFGFNILNAKAQVTFQQTRSADTIIYYIVNPFTDIAEITWTVTGGIINGHSSPYSADGADSIQVIWDDSNKTTANYGSLIVSEVIKWPGGPACSSPEEQIHVEAWNRPKAITDPSDLIICSGESFTIKVDFEGKPEYKYKWKLYDKDYPSLIIEDQTAEFINSIYSSTDIHIAGIDNNSNAEKIYEFEITDVQDGITDSMPGNVSMARVTIHIQPKTPAGILKNNNHLIRR